MHSYVFLHIQDSRISLFVTMYGMNGPILLNSRHQSFLIGLAMCNVGKGLGMGKQFRVYFSMESGSGFLRIAEEIQNLRLSGEFPNFLLSKDSSAFALFLSFTSFCLCHSDLNTQFDLFALSNYIYFLHPL